MMKLKLQSFGHLMCRTDSLEKTLMLGKIGGRRAGWHHRLNAHEFEQTLGDGEALSSLSEAHREALCAAVHGVSKIRHNSVTEQQQGTLNFFQSQE